MAAGTQAANRRSGNCVAEGWRRLASGRGSGKPFLVKLEGPTLVQPINCALTPQPDGSYGLIWSREKPSEETTLTEEIAA
jgi:uncharacterized protein (DUF736 family)